MTDNTRRFTADPVGDAFRSDAVTDDAGSTAKAEVEKIGSGGRHVEPMRRYVPRTPVASHMAQRELRTSLATLREARDYLRRQNRGPMAGYAVNPPAAGVAVPDAAVPTIDPTTLNMGLLVRDYAGTNWPGVASGGISGAVTLGPVVSAPTVSTALNGHACALYNGSRDLSSAGTGGTGQVLSDFFSETSGGGYAIVEFTALVADPGLGNRFNAPGVFDDSGNTAWFISAHVGGATFGATDSVAANEATSAAITVGPRYFVQWKWDGVDIYIRIDGGAWVPTPSGGINTPFMGAALRLGVGFGGGVSAKIWEAGVTPDVWDDATFNGVRAFDNVRYGLAM